MISILPSLVYIGTKRLVGQGPYYLNHLPVIIPSKLDL